MNIHLNKLTLIPELRVETASDKVFTNAKNVATTGAGNFLIAAVYKF